MWTAILSFLGGPLINGAINAYKAKLESTNTTDAHAADLAKADLLAQIEARKQATILAGSPWGSRIQAAFGAIVLLYVGKVVIWDTMLGLGSTPAVRGDVATWMSLIISFFMGGQVVSSAVATIASRFKR